MKYRTRICYSDVDISLMRDPGRKRILDTR
jgi:hypothetical protein